MREKRCGLILNRRMRMCCDRPLAAGGGALQPVNHALFLQKLLQQPFLRLVPFGKLLLHIQGFLYPHALAQRLIPGPFPVLGLCWRRRRDGFYAWMCFAGCRICCCFR